MELSTELKILSQSKPAGSKYMIHWMPWFGNSSHVSFLYNLNGVDIPYVSSDPNIVADQVAKMKAANIDAVQVFYNGKKSPNFPAVKAMFDACVVNGLQFSVCINNGPVGAVSPNPDTPAQQYIEHINYVIGAFTESPAYMRDSLGRPIVGFFDEMANTDWTAVANGLIDSCALIFNGGKWTHPAAAGCYGWLNPVTGQPWNINVPAIQSFVAGALANPTMSAWYPVYAKFDDSLVTPPQVGAATPNPQQQTSGWGSNRVILGYHGRTLLTTLSLVPKGAPWIIIPTWNDHEEGSGVEGGVRVAQ